VKTNRAAIDRFCELRFSPAALPSSNPAFDASEIGLTTSAKATVAKKPDTTY
jgi:hypothetical protein